MRKHSELIVLLKNFSSKVHLGRLLSTKFNKSINVTNNGSAASKRDEIQEG